MFLNKGQGVVSSEQATGDVSMVFLNYDDESKII